MGLKRGFTTGTCAAIAVKAAIRMIFDQKPCEYEQLVTPNGSVIGADTVEQSFDASRAECAVCKYSGDDPDVTNGMLIFASVRLLPVREIIIDGGRGIGRVTKPGLALNVGEAAINPVPRKMIRSAAEQLFDEYAYYGGAEIIISAPMGEDIAKKTFNPRLGIVGGISILGTSGIVEPMSEQAIVETIRAELSVKRAAGVEYVMLAPGNYGVDFMRNNYGIDLDTAVKCSNFLGEALDIAAELDFSGVLLVGHIGKLIKAAGGIMNTHSKNADSRMEIIAANAVMVCDDIEVIRKLMGCLTTDDAVGLLKEKGICDSVMERLVKKAKFYIDERTGGKMQTGIIMFSNIHGRLGESENAPRLLKMVREGK